MNKIICNVERITFHNPESGYAVLYVSQNGKPKYLTLVIKDIPDVYVGMNLSVEGFWDNNERFGKQFIATEWKEEMPTSAHGIELYLSSDLFHGIGPKTAKKIVSYFGEDTLKIIESKSEELLKVPKLGRKKVEEIWQTWDENKVSRDIMIFLKSYGIGNKTAIKILTAYGSITKDIINENPYQLITDIEGIGFETADQLARKLKFNMFHPKRIEAGIIYTLQIAGEDGHTFLSKDVLTQKSKTLLNVGNELINDSIIENIQNDKIIAINDKIYLPLYYNAEKKCKDSILNILMTKHNNSLKVDIDELEKRFNIKYETEQKEAIMKVMTSNMCIITGGPGTGKTTITRGIIEALDSNFFAIECAAPTGKASDKMSEVTGKDAKTIHRLLEYNPKMGWGRTSYNPLVCDAVVIDESSMINILLFEKLLDAILPNTKLIIIGDVDQLPAIGAGNVLHDMIESEVIPVVRLNKIFRQAQNSDIIMTAHNINKGIMPSLKNKKDNDLFFMPEINSNNAAQTIYELISKRLPKCYGVKSTDIQILTPMKMGNCGIFNLNENIQNLLNPDGKRGKFTTFRVGDKVMQIENNYDLGVFNGDSGFVTDIDDVDKKLYVKYDDKVIEYNSADMEQLMLSYAITIHKSQGSEYPIVVIPIMNEHYSMLTRNLIYTAITRAKQVCILIGNKEMIKKAVDTLDNKERCTSLKVMLQEDKQFYRLKEYC